MKLFFLVLVAISFPFSAQVALAGGKRPCNTAGCEAYQTGIGSGIKGPAKCTVLITAPTPGGLHFYEPRDTSNLSSTRESRAPRWYEATCSRCASDAIGFYRRPQSSISASMAIAAAAGDSFPPCGSRRQVIWSGRSGLATSRCVWAQIARITSVAKGHRSR